MKKVEAKVKVEAQAKQIPCSPRIPLNLNLNLNLGLVRRGARVAESGGLENRCRGNSTVGSNPTLSAR